MTRLCETDLPRKGWEIVDVIDHEDELQLCPWCERQEFRFGHIMEHPDVGDSIEVGRICAEHISEDYKDAEARERRVAARTKKAREEAEREAEAQRQREANADAFESEYRKVRWRNAINKWGRPVKWCNLFGKCVSVELSQFSSGWRIVTKNSQSPFVYNEPDTIAAIKECLRKEGVL